MNLTFLRYAVSGGVATGAHFLVLVLLVEYLRLEPLLSTVCGFGVAIVVNYSIQYYWTFSSTVSHKKSFVRYLLVTLAMMLVNVGVFWVLESQLQAHYLLAQAVATILVMLVNFNINQRFTFQSQV